MKIRTKYTVSIITLIVGTAMNILKIPIQDNWVKLALGILGIIAVGFGIKTAPQILEKVAEVFKK